MHKVGFNTLGFDEAAAWDDYEIEDFGGFLAMDETVFADEVCGEMPELLKTWQCPWQIG
jgi:hypothetical protein